MSAETSEPEATKPTERVGEQTIITTVTELKEAIGAAVKDVTAGLSEAIETMSQQVGEIKKTQEEAANAVAPITGSELATETPAPIAPEVIAQAAETAGQAQTAIAEVKAQAVETAEHIAAKATEHMERVVAQAAEKTEQVVAQAAETAGQAQTAIAEVKAQAVEAAEQARAAIEDVKIQAAETIEQAKTAEPEKKPDEIVTVKTMTPPQSKNKSETTAVEHLGHVTQVQARVNQVRAYESLIVTIILTAGMALCVGLYLTERAASEQRAIADTKVIRELAQDLITAHLLKNENIEAAIQTKMDALRNSGIPDSRAIPMAYIDGEVIKEIINDLPPSTRNLPYIDELVFNELKRISAYAEKELNKR